MPRVSVVCASYNHEPFVTGSLRSALDQSYRDLEVVVTDDGSSDRTADRVEQVAKGDPRVRFERFPENRGACEALNNSIERASGKYIAVLNSDDEFVPTKIETQVGFLDAHPEIAAVFGRPLFVDDAGRPYPPGTRDEQTVFVVENRSRHEWLDHFFHRGNRLCHPTVLIRREVYDRVGLYDVRMAQLPDFDMWIRVCSAYDIHVLPQELTRFRLRAGMANASGLRPEVMVRLDWERTYVFSRFFALAREDLERVFPDVAEFKAPGVDITRALARHMVRVGSPAAKRCGLDTLFRAMEGERSGGKDLVALTGAHDVHRLLAASALERAGRKEKLWRAFKLAARAITTG